MQAQSIESPRLHKSRFGLISQLPARDSSLVKSAFTVTYRDTAHETRKDYAVSAPLRPPTRGSSGMLNEFFGPSRATYSTKETLETKIE